MANFMDINNTLQKEGFNVAKDSGNSLIRSMANMGFDNDSLEDFSKTNKVVNDTSYKLVSEVTAMLFDVINQSVDFLSDDRYPSFDDYLPNKTKKIRR